MAEASLWRTDKEEDTLSSGNLSVLSSFGESFMDMVAKNACSWHAVSRVSGRGCANIINYNVINNAHITSNLLNLNFQACLRLRDHNTIYRICS